MKVLFFVGLLLTLVMSNAQGKDSYSKKELADLWQDVGNNSQKLVTSNSKHYWAWSKNEAEAHLGAYLGAKGIVMGDPHIRNVFDHHVGDHVSLAVSDLDDGGVAPLILDICRYLVYLEASDLDMKMGEVFNQYLEGLQGNATRHSELFKKAQEESQADIEAQHLRYVEKNGAEGKFDNDNLDLTGRKSLSDKKIKIIDSLAKVVQKYTGEEKIWDEGFRENDSGSSAGMARYWYLTGTKNKPKHILEAKELGKAAVAYYQNQDGHKKRVLAVAGAYSEGKFISRLFGVIESDNKTFWLRPRKFQALDLNDSDLSQEEQQEFALQLANWMGLMQARQKGGQDLWRKIKDSKKEVVKEKVEGFVRAYLEAIDEM